MESINSKRRLSIRQMTTIGMLSAISIFLGLTGIGLVQLPFLPLRVTIMHIPVIIGSIVEGPIVGAIIGLVFGAFSMYQNFTAPGPTSFIFWNPIIALLPRIFIGIIAYYIYKFLKNQLKNQSLSIAISAICTTCIHTASVLGLAYLIYLEKYSAVLGLNPDTAGSAIAVIGLTNGVPEAIVSAIISVPVIMAILKIRK